MIANETALPIVIGMSGHRDLRPQDMEPLRQRVREVLSDLIARCPHTPFTLLTGLAEGADQLCAEVALSLGVSLAVALPRPLESFREDFAGEPLAAFDRLFAAADSAVVVENVPPEMQPDEGYRQVGVYIARHSHLLLALWSGQAPTATGCGTAEVVDFFLQRHFPGAMGDAFATADSAVIQIVTPRVSMPDIPDALSIIRMENMGGSLDRVLSSTDAFNGEVLHAVDSYPLVDDQTLLEAGPGIARIHTLYLRACALSTRYRDRYMRCVKWLSILSVAIVLAFLLYDNMESNLFLPLYGVFMLFAAIYLRRVRKGLYHPKYLDYRVLAECLRVQTYLLLCGIDHCATDDMNWSVQCDLPWVRRAVPALLVGVRALDVRNEAVAHSWVDGQLKYHSAKNRAIDKQDRINNAISGAMFGLTVIVYLVVCVLEFLPSSVMNSVVPLEPARHVLLLHAGQEVNLRGLVKILLGVSSAVSLFLSSYYGKLSLTRKLVDCDRMALLFGAAARALAVDHTHKDEILRKLAREEIIETCDWLSYCRDNRPGFSI